MKLVIEAKIDCIDIEMDKVAVLKTFDLDKTPLKDIKREIQEIVLNHIEKEFVHRKKDFIFSTGDNDDLPLPIGGMSFIQYRVEDYDQNQTTQMLLSGVFQDIKDNL